MFNLVEKSHLLQLFYGDNPVMADISFELQINKTGEIPLEFVEAKQEQRSNHQGEFKRYVYMYKHGEQIELSFTVDAFDLSLHGYVDLKIHSEKLFGQNDYIKSQNGLSIKIKNLGELEGMLAFYRHKDWWSRPHFNKDITTLPERTQTLLWSIKDSYFYLLPTVGPIFKSEIVGTGDGMNITLSSYDGGRASCHTPVFVLGKGDNPFHLAQKVTKEALEISGKSTKLREEKRYPERLDYLGWCSWDAFYHKVNEEGIINKLKELKEKQVPVKWVMIDDGWLKVSEERLSGFEPDPVKFPKGFKWLTEQLKEHYGVDSVGVWHTLAGYWGGIAKESALAIEMAPYLFNTNSQKLIPYPDKGKGYGFWDSWHSYLQQQGIDFVKVDGQSAVNNFMMEQMSIGEASRETHKALEASVGIHFDQCMINCMGMASENIFNRPLSSLSRSSDDFVPDDEKGFAEHALQNVYNSFYHGEIYWGDWDMFWTKHKDASRHALLRALSGGPIYTSDRVDQTDAEVLKPLIYQDGRILRCDKIGRPTQDTLMVDPTKGTSALKVWNTSKGSGLLGVFNVSDGVVEANIALKDIEGLQAEVCYVLDYFNKEVKTLKKDESIKISLEEEGYCFYLFLPRKENVTPIGLINKYVSPATFDQLYTTEDKTVVRLYEGGKFAFLSEKEPKEVRVNGQVTPLTKDGSCYIIDSSECQSRDIIIEIF